MDRVYFVILTNRKALYSYSVSERAWDMIYIFSGAETPINANEFCKVI